jgi:hypothetical protein
MIVNIIDGKSFKVYKREGIHVRNGWVYFRNYIGIVIRIPKTSILYIQYESGDRKTGVFKKDVLGK